ncbi:MAG: hypothetical protein QXU20_00960 [Candidatus Woesearchaeota archaeon]
MKFGLFKKEAKKQEQKTEAIQQKTKNEVEVKEQFPAFPKQEQTNFELKSPFEVQNFPTIEQKDTKIEEQNLNEIQEKPQPIIINPSLNPDVQREVENKEQKNSNIDSKETTLFSGTIIEPPKSPEFQKPTQQEDYLKEQDINFYDYSNLKRIEPLILKPEEESFETRINKTQEKPKQRELFININSYKEILQEIKNLKIILESTNYYLDDAEEQDKKEEKVINELKSRLEDVERKILLIDKILFEK